MRLEEIPLDGEELPHMTHHDFFECNRIALALYDEGRIPEAMQLAMLIFRASVLRNRQQLEEALLPAI